MSTEILKINHHRYKLNSNAPNTSVSVSGVILTDKWSPGELNPRPELASYIKSNSNPEGWVDYEIFIPFTKEVIYSSHEAMHRQVPVYRPEELMVMNRNDLVRVVEYYGIDPVNKTNQYLISLITQKQKERAEKEGKVEEIPEPLTASQVKMEQDKLKQKSGIKSKAKSNKEPPKMW